MTKVFKNINQWLQFNKNRTGSLGFVPTMGALHKGHLELVKRAKIENEFCVVSIFVNPTQFNDKKDLEKYPRDYEQDLELLNKHGVDFLLYPNYKDIYPDNYRYKITEQDFSKKLCGSSRPGHFDGVLSIVMKLFNITKADKAYFGEKDYQQLQLIKDMVSAFFVPTKVVAVPTVREEDGLAMSSRNLLLSREERQLAGQLNHVILNTTDLELAKQKLNTLGFSVDYCEDIKNRRFVAAKLGKVRLIDNVQI